MHDPMTVAFEIRRPWPEPSSFIPGHRYYPPIVTIWHVDPERDGSDDSCGWFMRPRHGDQAVREEIRRTFARFWDGEHSGWFHADTGLPVQSVQATTLGLFRRAACVYFGESWRKAERFLRRNLLFILGFAENRIDSLSDALMLRWGYESREQRIAEIADTVYGCILRLERPWWRHPRWHVHHWRIQIHAALNLKRWLFSRCESCGKRFPWGYSPTSRGWGGDGPQWFRGERGVFHHECCSAAATIAPDAMRNAYVAMDTEPTRKEN